MTLKAKEYSRLTYALAAYGILEQYALEFVRAHERIAPVDEFHLSDEDYAAFVEFACSKDFDYRSSARAFYDKMKEELDKDGLSNALSGELEALKKGIEIEKKDYLEKKKDEIIPLLEQEIVTRYYFQQAGIQMRIRYDDVLHQALKAERIPRY